MVINEFSCWFVWLWMELPLVSSNVARVRKSWCLSGFWSETICKCGISRCHVGGIWRARKCGIFQHAIPISWQLLSGKQTLCKLGIMVKFRAIPSSFTWDMAFIAMFAYYSGTRPRVQPWIPGIARMWFVFKPWSKCVEYVNNFGAHFFGGVWSLWVEGARKAGRVGVGMQLDLEFWDMEVSWIGGTPSHHGF